ncbi:zinc finger CCCH domain-containing protein 62 [Arachis ipaensis]|nr:zinc finger CCCH domain-containing protein 62 [Arachis ipaensis]XP_020967035.1 zinc finger CCCH domain-containing protein 62 [Arachis ipaensis]
MLERLKVDECKLYLRKNCLRLSGNKDVLVQRIKEHLQIINGGGERKYPPSSFVLDCKGDACTGDVVLFEQNVYEMFNIASRSASGPSCGKRTVAGRIVKESYGTAKQQHTFTIEVLWSKGEKPFPPLHPLLIKGRNLYRLKTLRQKWEDEGERQKILTEKHSRGSIAREDREARVQEKVNRKAIVENRVSRKHSVIHHPHAINQEKPAFPSKSSAVSAINQEKPPFPSVVTEQGGKSVSSRRSNESTSFGVNHVNNQQDWKHSSDPIIKAQLGDLHSKQKEQYQYQYHPSERNRFAQRNPLTSANHLLPLLNNREIHKQKQLCRYYARGRCYFGDNCKFVHDLILSNQEQSLIH